MGLDSDVNRNTSDGLGVHSVPGGSTTQGSLWADQVPQLISPRVLLCFLSDCSNAKTNPGRAAQSFSRLSFKGLWSVGQIEEGIVPR